MKYSSLALLLVLTLVSCELGTESKSRYLSSYGSVGNQSPDNGAALPDNDSYWAGDGIDGSPSVKIDLSQQKAYFYKNSTLVGVSRISTGKDGHDTPPGTYKITQKNKDHRSNLYGIYRNKQTGEIVNDDVDTTKDKLPPGCEYVGAPMKYFMRFNGGIGMHTGYLPGYNASHGCVRMPDKMAKKFFENTEIGTPVIVQR